MKKRILLTAIGVLLMLPLSGCLGGGKTSEETHNFVKHDAVSATCESAGNAEYYTCSDCDKLFDAAQKEITEIPTVDALGHAYVLQAEKGGTCVEKGEISHYTCENCDKLFNLNRQEITSIEGSLDETNHAHNATVVVQTQPTKVTYKAGEAFDPTGMVAVYKCEACDGEVIDARYLTYTYETEGATAFTLGDTKVTAQFGGVSFDIAVTVEKGQVEITGVEAAYETVCGQAPQINAVCSIADLEIIVKYYDGETEIDASQMVAGTAYTAKVSVAETADVLGAEVTATVNVTHGYVWETVDDADVLVCQCVCGAAKDYRIIDNQIIFVDDTDMSLDLSKLVVGTNAYTVKSIQQVLTLNNHEKVDIVGVNEDMVYTFDVNSYEKTPTQEGEDVVYYTPYDLVLEIVFQFEDGNERSVTLISKYVEKVIRNAEDLSTVMYTDDPDASGVTTNGYYVLADDIDASGLTLAASQPCWNAHSGFVGIFDGNGHTISNLTIPAWHQGLFGAIGYNGRIQNVSFDNVTLGDGSYLLAFAMRNASLKDVNVSFALESASFLVAYTANASTLENVNVHTCKGINPFFIDEDPANELPEGVALSYYKYYTVTFDTVGGNAIDSVEVTTGKKVAMPANPVKESEEFDYVFLGWYLDGAAYDFNAAVTEDITLVAQWEEKEKITPDDVIAKIAVLPDEVTMPDHIYFVARIREAQAAYKDLPAEVQAQVTNYAKLESLLDDISGYNTVYTQSTVGVDVIPSYVPGGFASAVGGSASIRQDDLYGNVLTVTSDAEGKAAVQFNNFPSVNKYNKIYIIIRTIGASCDIYLSDGIINDGWGADWKNTWSMSGFWVNDGSWDIKAIDVSTEIFKSEWALGLRTNTNGVSFEIADIIGSYEAESNTGLTFGNFVDSGTTNEHGTVYNLTQGWTDNYAFGAFNTNALVNAAAGFDYLTFWIYNPTDSVSTFYFNEDGTWTRRDVQDLAAQSWTQVIISADLIAINADVLQYVCVSSGANAAGWQISPIFAVIAE